MDKITPLDLERANLPTGLRGYRKEPVNSILISASNQLESQLVEIRRLGALLRNAESELDRFRVLESTLNSALVLAQKTGDETRLQAHKEAELIVEAAKQEANEVRRASEESIRALKWEAERLECEKNGFAHRFRALLSEHLTRLNDEIPTHAVLQVESQEAATG